MRGACGAAASGGARGESDEAARVQGSHAKSERKDLLEAVTRPRRRKLIAQPSYITCNARLILAQISSRFRAFGICAEATLKIRTQEMLGNSQLVGSVNPHARARSEHEDNSYASANQRQ